MADRVNIGDTVRVNKGPYKGTQSIVHHIRAPKAEITVMNKGTEERMWFDWKKLDVIIPAGS